MQAGAGGRLTMAGHLVIDDNRLPAAILEEANGGEPSALIAVAHHCPEQILARGEHSDGAEEPQIGEGTPMDHQGDGAIR